MSNWVFLNDEFLAEEKAALHFRDLSVMRGYGIFDFLKVLNGVPVFIDDHLNRFYFSAAEMMMDVSYSKDELKNIINELLKKNGTPDTGLRITLTGGYSKDGYQLAKPNLIISLHSFQPPTPDQFEKGIKLITYQHQRQLPHVKTIDYLMAIWLQPAIHQKNADDVLYHQNGIISECPRSNIFFVTNENKLVTPAKNILKGVVRQKILHLAKEICEIEERDISIYELVNVSEVFITSTTKSILPVAQIDEYRFNNSKTVSRHLNLLLQHSQNNTCGNKHTVV